MHLFKTVYLVSVLTLVHFSCDRVKRKGNQFVDTAKNTLAEKKANLSDKIIAHYDPYHPDTKFNKKRFLEFFTFETTPDIKDIYCYADEMGIDHDYQFAFTCDSVTIDKIATNLKLIK